MKLPWKNIGLVSGTLVSIMALLYVPVQVTTFFDERYETRYVSHQERAAEEALEAAVFQAILADDLEDEKAEALDEYIERQAQLKGFLQHDYDTAEERKWRAQFELEALLRVEQEFGLTAREELEKVQLERLVDRADDNYQLAQDAYNNFGVEVQ